MIGVDGPWFKDEHGRTLLLRGVNLGGSSKVPFSPDGATYRSEGFFNHRQVSFVGRPFPLEQADEHFSRLKRWGFDFLRFLVTWEAIEHAGPGLYDQAYLDYVYGVIRKADEHGIRLFIDPHQDVWSRFSGGDGAPGWTFEKVGLDITKFAETGAAIVHQTHGDPFPRMVWPTNGAKLAAATMFTLFFGGSDFAPAMKIDGEPVQEYLQRHYIAAIRQVAARLKDLPNVVGYDTMNEPLPGFIGWRDLRSVGGLLNLGESPSPFQSMLLGAGVPQDVDLLEMGLAGPRRTGTRLLNPEAVRAWLPGFECPWAQAGVWGLDPSGTPQLLRPDHFSRVGERQVDFSRDYYRPFAQRFAEAIRSADPRAILFIEPGVGHAPPPWRPEDPSNIAYAPHWYDGFVLLMKSYSPLLAADMDTGRVVVGPGRIRRSFAEQLARPKRHSRERLGGVPTLIGEFGIGFDMKQKRAYRTGDFSEQIRAMDRSFRAIEANLLSCTLWNYTPDNSNAHGDQWNDEDLSLFSRDQQSDPADPNSGGRALEGCVRPYPRRTAGEPLHLSFDWKRKEFRFAFRHDDQVTEPTEIFVPDLQYPRGCHVEVSDGDFELRQAQQTLIYRHTLERQVHRIRVRPA
jgi:hypothetical protein